MCHHLSRRANARLWVAVVLLVLGWSVGGAQTPPVYPALEAPADLAAWWPANGTPTEVIHGGHDVTLLNGATFAAGEAYQSFSFNGTSAYATTPAHPDLDIGSSASGLTIEFWIRPTRIQDGQILMSWSSSTAPGVRLLQTFGGDGLWVYLTDTAGQDHLLRIDGGFFPLNVWTHVAVTYDRVTGATRIFRNAEMRVETNLGVFAPRTALPLSFGGSAAGGYFQGQLDEISLYTRALTVSEIGAIYEAAAGGKALPDDNLPPRVNAGPDEAVLKSDGTAVLQGSVLDDDKPFGAPAISWSKVDGPGPVTFADAHAASTTATFDTAGTYLLKLTASDGFNFPVADSVLVRVGIGGTTAADPSLSAWWPANGELDDVVHGGHQIEFINGTTLAAGQVSQALLFDGGNDQARIAAHADLDIGASTVGLSIEFWAKPTRVADNQMMIAWGTPTTTGVRIVQTFGGTGLWVYLTDVQSTDHLLRIDGGFFPMNAWTHVAITYDRTSGMARLYRNSELWIETNLGIFAPRTAFPMTLGSYYNGSYYKGLLDEISLYTRPLTATDVLQIYQAGVSGKSPVQNNHSPVVNAGVDVVVADAGGTASLEGAVTDDDQPAGSLSIQWSKLDGPGSVTFADSSAAVTSATFSAAGTYVLKLTGSDGLKSASDMVTVRVGLSGAVSTDPALAAWWPANGDAHEAVKGGHDAEFYNGATFGAGEVSQAFVFDGSNDQARIAAHADLDIGASAAGLTIEFWAKPGRVADNQMLIGWGTSTTTGVRIVQTYGGTGIWIYLTDVQGTDHLLHIDGGFFPIDVWTHVAITYDRISGVACLYRNSELWIETNVGKFTPRTSLPLNFGSFYSGSYYKGSLDEVSFYTRPLRSTDVYRIYQAGTIGKSPLDDNNAPVVDAGPDQVADNYNMSVSLAGSATDDHKPAGVLSVQWSKADGPGVVAFADATASVTTASFSAVGTYILKLSASDGLKSASDTVMVRVGVPGAAIADPALAAWWPANGDAHEAVKGGHDAEFYNGTTFGAGEVSQAFVFDGSNDEARIAAHADLDIGASSAGLTIEFWAKPSRVADSQMLIGWGTSAMNGVRIYQHYAGTGLWVYLTDTDGIDHLVHVDGGFFSIDAWTHAAITYDRATGVACVYRNSELWVETNAGKFTPRTALPLNFGSFYNGAYYKGSLDEISFYTRPLSATDILRIYGAGTIGKSPVDDNMAPIVDAGPDQVAEDLNARVSLGGSATDDQKPTGNLSIQWSKADGPGMVTFADANAPVTTATFSAAGTYVLKLTGSDGLKVTADMMTVRVGLTGAVIADASLVAWWPANGDAHEVVKGGHDAASYNGATFSAGEVSQAFLFDGVNDQRRITASADLDIGASTAGLTIEFWVKPGRVADSQMLIGWGTSTTNGVRIYQHYGGTGLWVYLTDTSGGDHLVRIDGGLFAADVWTHVAITYDRTSGFACVYRNSELWTETNVGKFAPRTDLPMTLGSFYNGSYYKGSLDEISLYTRPLTSSEVAAIFRAGAAGKGPVDDNAAPVVSAGSDRVAAGVADSVPLSGIVNDDHRPAGILTIAWSKVEGPGNVTFADASSAETTATFSAAGTYVLRLTAGDGLKFASDTMTVHVGLPGLIEADFALAAWWPGNGDVHEVVHGGHDVEFYNGTTYGAGEVAQAFSFDGSNDQARIAAHTDLDIGASAVGLSIEFWARPLRAADSQMLIGWGNSTASGVRIYQHFNGTGLWVYLTDVTGADHLVRIDGGFFPIDAWTHVAVTYDKTSGFARVYRNGAVIAQVNAGVFVPRTNLPLSFGSGYNGAYYKGLLDEISLYSRPLGASEIAAIYQASSAGKNVSAANVTPITRFIAPSTGETVGAGLPVTLTVFAADADGTIAKVEFFDGATKLGETTGPDAGESTLFSLNVATGFATTGTHTLTARVVDDVGGVAVAAGVRLEVLSAVPSISVITPVNGGTVLSGSPLLVTAEATYSSGAINRVEFFDGQTRLGIAYQADHGTPNFSLVVPSGLPLGSHPLKVKATADDGAFAFSSVVEVLVGDNNGPSLTNVLFQNSPIPEVIRSNGVFTVTALDPDGVGHVEFKIDGVVLADDVTAGDGASASFKLRDFPLGPHTLEITAWDDFDEPSETTTVSFATELPGLPAPPSSLVAAAVSSSQVSLTWNGTLTPGSIVEVERKTGAAGVYSLLTEVYGTAYLDTEAESGSAYVYRIRVRDAVDQTSDYSNEATVTALAADIVAMPVESMRLWLVADSGVIPGRVSQWLDQSGHGKHASQLAADLQPLMIASAVNGRSVMRFDGVNDFMGVAPFMTDAAAGEMFAVLKARQAPTNGARGPWSFGTSLGAAYPNGGQLYDDFGSTTQWALGTPAATLTSFHVYNASSRSGEWAARLDGIPLFRSTTNAVAFRTNPLLGRTAQSIDDFFFDGDLAEILVFDRVLSDRERQTVENYLFARYQIALPRAVLVPQPGTSAEPVSLSIVSPQSEAEIYYTVDGTSPIRGISLRYSGPFTISQTTNVRAAVFMGENFASGEVSGLYSIGHAPDPLTPVSGLAGEYFESANFAGSSTWRLDRVINNPSFSALPLSWQSTAASVKWQGEVIARFTEAHDFIFKSNGGLRVWFGDALVIDDWAGSTSRELMFSASLIAGSHYPVRIEYQRRGAASQLTVEWRGPSTAREVVPETQLTCGLSPLSGTGFQPGLSGEYFPNTALSGPSILQRVENVNFDWGGGSPDPTVPTDHFSIRWTGGVTPTVSGSYSFATNSDDGVRLWLGDQLLIDNWGDHGATTNTSNPIELIDGSRTPLRLEYYENGGGATIQLFWKVPGSSSFQIIPFDRLSSAGGISAATPTANPPAGIYGDNVSIVLSSMAPLTGARIYYTLDGSEPSSSSALYTAPIVLHQATTLKARTYGTDLHPSGTLIANYVIDNAAPVLSGLTFNGAAFPPTLTSSGTIGITATDISGVSHVDFTLDGQLLGSDAVAADGFTVSFEIGNVADGSHVLTAQATDSTGLVSPLFSANVVVAMPAPPAPVLTAPANNSKFNQSAVTIRGTAQKLATITLYRADEVAGSVQAGADGNFSIPTVLLPGSNRFTATAASRNPAPSIRSNAVELTFDNTVPAAPSGLTARSKASGQIRVDWQQPPSGLSSGFYVFRSNSPIPEDAEFAPAMAVSPLVHGTSYTDTPAEDGRYYYRVANAYVVGNDVTLSVPSGQADAFSDRVAPTAQLRLEALSTLFDAANHRYGPGLVRAILTVSEPLAGVPFLNLASSGGSTILVDLTPDGETSYRGVFAIATSTQSGAVNPVLSATDVAGNRGSQIALDVPATIDTRGPEVIGFTRVSVAESGSLAELPAAESIKNEPVPPATAVTLSWLVTFDESPRSDATPIFSAALSSHSAAPLPVAVTNAGDADPRTWVITVSLPAEAGEETETLTLAFSAVDDLGNPGNKIIPPHTFQIYQGNLPPLTVPPELRATALPAGAIRLDWTPVAQASAHILQTKGPSDADFADLQTLTGAAATYTHVPPVDGLYSYRIASVRTANDQDAISGWSEVASARSDRVPPPSPSALAIDVIPQGVKATWNAPADTSDVVGYSLYRSASAITDVSLLTPAIANIPKTALSAVDATPVKTSPYYALITRDAAGNISPPLTGFGNVSLLPVTTLKVDLTKGSAPVVSWAAASGSVIDGFGLSIDGASVSVAGSVLLPTGQESYADSAYVSGDRLYAVKTVSGPESRERTLRLPDVFLALLAPELKRGLMNTLQVEVRNTSTVSLEDALLNLWVVGRDHASASTFTLSPGEVRTIPVVVGGYDDLPAGSASVAISLIVKPHAGEQVTITRLVNVPVAEGALTAEIMPGEFTRGGTGKVRFKLLNPSSQPIEFKVARASGSQPSDEVRLKVSDAQGAVLSTTPLQIALGDSVVGLPDGTTIVRVPAGGSYVSPTIDLPLPAAAPSLVTVGLEIDSVYYAFGSGTEVKLRGPRAQAQVSTLSTAYRAEVSLATPEISNGSDPIMIRGRALWSNVDPQSPVAGAPFVPVVVSIRNQGFIRRETKTTDGSGQFEYSFQVGAKESGGVYDVWASHPDVTAPTEPASSFVIRRVLATPTAFNVRTPRNYRQALPFQVSTGAGTTITNLRLELVGPNPPDVAIETTPLASLGALQTASVPLSIMGLAATPDAPSSGSLQFRVVSANGAGGESVWETLTVNYEFTDARPIIQATPNLLQMGVQSGLTASETIELKNLGYAPLDGGVLTLVSADAAPLPSWITLQTLPAVGSVDVGQSVAVRIAAAPPVDGGLIEQVYSGLLRLSGTNTTPVDFPFSVAVSPEGKGSAVLKIVDPYFQLTFADHTTNAAFDGLHNASVGIENETSTGIPSVTRAGQTDANGEILFDELPAGRYKLRVSADRHEPYIGRVTIKPGVLYSQQIQLTYAPVTFTWEVVPVTFQDVYNIVLTATFETNVPVPVLVVEPGAINLPKMCAGQVYAGEFKISNHGLIDAKGIQIPVPASDENFSYELGTGVPEKIGAGQSMTIPYKVRCLKPLPEECPEAVASTASSPAGFATMASTSFGNAGCFTYSTAYEVRYKYDCANGLSFDSIVRGYFVKSYGTCGGTGSGSSPPVWVSNSGPGGSPTTTTGNAGSAGATGSSRTSGSFNECYPQPQKCKRQPGDCNDCDRIDQTGSGVDLATRQFVDEATDLVVAIPGGNITVSREFSSRRWRFNLVDDLYALKSSAGRFSLVRNGDEYQSTAYGAIDGTEMVDASLAPAGDYLLNGTGPQKITKQADGTFIWTESLAVARTYDAAGHLLTQTRTGGLLARYHYGADGLLSHITDRNDRTVLTALHQNGELTQVTDFAGRSISFNYDSSGRLSRVTDRFGRTASYSYDAAWQMTEKRMHVEGTPTDRDDIETIEHHSYAGLLNLVPPRRVIPGHAVLGDRVRGQVMSVAHNFGSRHSYEFNYDESQRIYFSRVTMSGGREIERTFDANGALVSRSLNGANIFRRDQAGRVRVLTLANRYSTTEELDERDRVVRRTLPNGAVEKTEYNPVVDKIARNVDAAGVVTEYEYDDLGNEIKKREAAGTVEERTTTSEYFPGTSLLMKRTDASGHSTAFEYDAKDQLIRIYDPLNAAKQTRYTYDDDGNRDSETDAMGNLTRWRYDSAGRLIEQINALEESTLYTYSGLQLTEIESGKTAEARGRIVRYTYDTAGHKTAEIRVDGSGAEKVFKKFEYDADDHLISEINALGQTLSYGYDASGNQISISQPDADGNPSVVTMAYGSQNRLVESIDAVGVKRTVEYDADDRPITAIEAVDTVMERSTRTRYDLAGRVIEIRQTDVRDPSRIYAATATYNSLGLRTQVGGDRPYAQMNTYDSSGRLTTQTDGQGRVSSYEYDADGRVHMVRVNGVLIASYDYDLVGNRITVTDGVGNHRHFHFDALNRVTEESVPFLASQLCPSDWWTQKEYILQGTTYTAFGEVASQTRYTQGISRVSEATTRATYDAFGRKQSDTDAAGATHLYTYDEADNLVSITFPPVASYGATTSSSITYLRSPHNCRLVDAVVDRAGNATHFVYDKAFRQTSETNSLGGVSVRAFDALGRVASFRDASGNTTLYEYSCFDQPVKITHADHVAGTRERIETLRYDTHGKLVEKAGAGDYPMTYAYDAVGNLISMTDANQHRTQWTFTDLNNVATKTYADGTVYRYTYDSAGRMLTRQDAMSRVTAYDYNAFGIPTRIDYPTDADVTFTYDQQGRRLSMDDGSGTTTWTYDAAGRPMTETQGRSHRTLHFSYGAESERTGLEVTAGGSSWATAYGYDNAGRLTSVLDDRVAAGPYVYGYAANTSLVSQVLAPGGLMSKKSYDNQGRITSVSATNSQLSTVSSFAYTYDAAGQRSTETSLERARAFTYDAQRQLTQSAATSGDSQLAVTDTFAYDGIGNRLTSSISTLGTTNTTSYTTNTVNQYTGWVGASTDAPAYDLNGNTTSLRGKVLRYDEENRLVEASDLTRTVTYIYDGLGRRVERIDQPAGGSVTSIRYVYDGWRSIEETDGAGVTLRSYTRGFDLSGSFEGAGGIGGLLGMSLSNGASWTTGNYFCDANGNVTDVIAASGNPLAHYTYSPFGERLTAAGAWKDETPFQFSSKDRDGFTGCYYYGYRFYDPVFGRWISRDPLQEQGGANLCAILSNDPIDRIDALGLLGNDGIVAKKGTGPSVADLFKYFKDVHDACECEKLRKLLKGALFSKAGYKNGGPPPLGSKLLKHVHDTESGFDASVFISEDQNEIAVVFRGTESDLVSAPIDWVSNFTQPDGIGPGFDQHANAVHLAGALKNEFSKQVITLYGHSGGASEAAIGSMATGLPAVIFNPAGVGILTALRAGVNFTKTDNITGAYVAGEALTTFEFRNPIPLFVPQPDGDLMELMPAGRRASFADDPRYRIQLHSIDAVIDAIKARMKKINCTEK